MNLQHGEWREQGWEWAESRQEGIRAQGGDFFILSAIESLEGHGSMFRGA